MTPKISVLILAKNEEDNIADCIKSCQKFANEIIVIDDYSEDNTAKIAGELGAKVIKRSLNGDWGEQQSFAIQQANYDWIFFIDADERVNQELAEELLNLTNKNKKIAYWVKRYNNLKNYKLSHGILRVDEVMRLMPKEGARVEGRVHQKIISPYPQEKIKRGGLIHYSYKNYAQYWRKFNLYTDLSAQKYLEKGKKFNFFRDLIIRPFWAFFKIYFINLGFLDGKVGFIFSVNHAFYTFTKYSKLYFLENSGGKL